MLPRTVFFSGCLLLTACTASTPMPDSNSLAGWEVVGDAEWTVQNGEIVGGGDGEGFIISREHFTDLRLKLEFLVESETNSGVFIRCQDPRRIEPDTCYEFNIWDEHPKQEARTGSIVFRLMPPLAHVETVGRWSTYEIVARGSSLKAWVNGQLTAELDTTEHSSGFIALQRWRTGTIRFRNIVVEPL